MVLCGPSRNFGCAPPSLANEEAQRKPEHESER